MDALADIGKAIKEIPKPFEDFQKEVAKNAYELLLGIGLDAGKGMGWKGYLFVWPFLAAFALAFILLLRNLLIFFF